MFQVTHLLDISPPADPQGLTQEQRQPLGGGDGTAFAVAVVLHGLAHGGGLTDVLHELLICQVHTLQAIRRQTV